MWKRSGKFLAFLAAALLCSSWVFSEEPEKVYYLTETEFSQLKMVFAGLTTENDALQNQLAELKAESGTLKAELGEVNASLTKATESLKTYADAMNRILLTERTKAIIYTIIGIAVGGASGYIIGAL